MKRTKLLLFVCVYFLSGCVSDQLAVFEKDTLTDDEMNALLGTYEVVALIGEDDKPLPKGQFKGYKLEVTKKDGEYHFAYKDEELSSGKPVLSRIPGQKAGLMLFASPAVKSNRHSDVIENVFFVLKVQEDTIQLWWILGKEPVAREFSFTRGAIKGDFKAAEIKEFLKKHAVEFVEKNPARITFKKTS